MNRAQRAELSAARKVLERPDDFSEFEVETAAAKVRALKRDAPDLDPVCPFCDRRVSTHIATDAPRDRHGQLVELGASLCPVVRDNGRLGRPERGEHTGWTYYNTPTREQIAAWRASHAGPKPPTREERRDEARRKQGTLL